MISNSEYVPLDGYHAVINRLGYIMSTPRVTVRSNGRPYTARGKLLERHWNGKHWQVWLQRVDGDGPGFRDLRYVHHLVLETFVEPRPIGLWGLHDDDDPDNNCVNNLYWGTASQNVLDSVRNLTHHHASKDRCLRGHLLSGANLASWGAPNRHCLSCNQANGLARYYGRIKDEPYIRDLSDAKYAALMEVEIAI